MKFQTNIFFSIKDLIADLFDCFSWAWRWRLKEIITNVTFFKLYLFGIMTGCAVINDSAGTSAGGLLVLVLPIVGVPP